MSNAIFLGEVGNATKQINEFVIKHKDVMTLSDY